MAGRTSLCSLTKANVKRGHAMQSTAPSLLLSDPHSFQVLSLSLSVARSVVLSFLLECVTRD